MQKNILLFLSIQIVSFITLAHFTPLFCQNLNSFKPYKVIGISDGDTFSVLDTSQKIIFKIRMDAIDAPEKGMPYWKKSKQFLSTLIFNQFVYFKNISHDSYNRYIARTFTKDDRDISALMIQNGYAWHYKKFNSEKLLTQYELSAQKKHLGLWKDKNPYPPATIRKMHKKGISTKNLFKNTVK